MLRVCWNYISNYCIIYEILQIGCQNIVSSTILEERLYVIKPESSVNPGKVLISMQSSSNPSEDWSEHLGVGMYALMMIKDFGCIQSL